MDEPVPAPPARPSSPVAGADPTPRVAALFTASNYSAGDWWRTGVVYQVYPRSFADSNGDGIGDLAGVIAHLDHLNDGTERSLGVDAVWLSPIYPSPGLDVGYDVADYTGVDPAFGTLDDVERLVAEAHRRGIKVILDLVLNHSSDQHPWFTASRASRDGPHADWYIWADAAGRTSSGAPRRPNNWVSFFGGPAWSWDETRGQFYLHTFLAQQPDLNWRNPAVREAMLDVIRTWLGRGIDGLRFDVFNAFFKDALLRSNPRRLTGRTAYARQFHVYDKNRPELAELLTEIRRIVDEKPGRMTVGELFEGPATQAAGYASARHLVFDFTLVETPWNAKAFAHSIAEREAAFGRAGWPTLVLSNHDRSRHASRYDDGDHAEARARVAAVLETSLRGTPFLYYGEEIALRDVAVPRDEIVDPPAKRATRFAPWWNRDQARAPMPWGPSRNGEFTTAARPWLRMSPDFVTRNVAVQSADPTSVLALYRRLLWFRRGRPALNSGGQEPMELGAHDVLGYVRRAGDEAALVVLGFSDRERAILLPETPSGRPWRVAISTHAPLPSPAADGTLILRGLEALVLVDDERDLPAAPAPG